MWRPTINADFSDKISHRQDLLLNLQPDWLTIDPVWSSICPLPSLGLQLHDTGSGFCVDAEDGFTESCLQPQKDKLFCLFEMIDFLLNYLDRWSHLDFNVECLFQNQLNPWKSVYQEKLAPPPQCFLSVMSTEAMLFILYNTTMFSSRALLMMY